MNWTFDGAAWTAMSGYAGEFRVYASTQLPGWFAEQVQTGQRVRLPTIDEAKRHCEQQDRRMRM
ncbi:hypothetical protein BH11PLA2_BH11PLA2_23360 [soil metagenome]